MTNITEAKWQVIANGRFVSQGRTVRENGVWSVKDVVRVDPKIPRRKENIFYDGRPSKRARDLNDNKDDDEGSSGYGDGDLSSQADTLSGQSSQVDGYADNCTVNPWDDQLDIRRRVRVCIVNPRHPSEALMSAVKQLNWRLARTALDLEADIYWHGGHVDELKVFSRRNVSAMNKLPGIQDLTQKVNLSRIVKRMQMLYPAEFDFYPQTWYLPNQLQQFIGEATQRVKKLMPQNRGARQHGMRRHTYIYKPSNGKQGDGIYLFSHPSNLTINARSAVVQRYVDNPLLIDGYKFDLRLYVFVSRLDPVEIYLCKDGLARLCTVKYEHPQQANLQNLCMHLTNYSLNKTSGTFQQTDAPNTGSKRTYKSIKTMLRRRGYNVQKMHKKIVNLCNKTILSMMPDIKVHGNAVNKANYLRPFQILGFDILLTSELEPILLEINSSPSLALTAERETFRGSGLFETTHSAVDEEVKVPLVRDCLRLVAYGEKELDTSRLTLERTYPHVRENFVATAAAAVVQGGRTNKTNRDSVLKSEDNKPAPLPEIAPRTQTSYEQRHYIPKKTMNKLIRKPRCRDTSKQKDVWNYAAEARVKTTIRSKESNKT